MKMQNLLFLIALLTSVTAKASFDFDKTLIAVDLATTQIKAVALNTGEVAVMEVVNGEADPAHVLLSYFNVSSRLVESVAKAINDRIELAKENHFYVYFDKSSSFPSDNPHLVKSVESFAASNEKLDAEKIAVDPSHAKIDIEAEPATGFLNALEGGGYLKVFADYKMVSYNNGSTGYTQEYKNELKASFYLSKLNHALVIIPQSNGGNQHNSPWSMPLWVPKAAQKQ